MNAREVAQAISEGINWLVVLADEGRGLDEGAPAAMEGLESALEEVRAKRVQTSMVVEESHLEGVRDVRRLVDEWAASGDRPEALAARARAAFTTLTGRTIEELAPPP